MVLSDSVPFSFPDLQVDHGQNTRSLETLIPLTRNSEPILIFLLVVALAASCLVLPPWSFLYFLGSAAWLQFRVFHEKGIRHLARAFGLILVVLMIPVLAYQRDSLVSLVPLPDFIFIGATLALLSGVALYFAARILMGFYLSSRDWLVFRPYSRMVTYTRKDIEDLFALLRTSSFRLRLVNAVARMPHPPSGAWSNGVPYVKEDPASTRLAQLEESWLGISSR